MMVGHIEAAKKVVTFDLTGKENGFLTELFKEGNKTLMYLTSVKRGEFKGYHLHRVRASRYFCIKGKVKIILYKNKEREEYILDATNPSRLLVQKNIAAGIQNIGDEDAWLINFPDPPYDPALKNEQVDYTEEELKNGVEK